MLIYNAFLLAWLTSLFGILLWNLQLLGSVKKGMQPKGQVRLSVLVPARDEERTIQACVESLLKQDYANYEVIVLDDHSTDKTAQYLLELQQRYPHLKTLKAKDLPPDWHGKAFACEQLGQTADGEILLFTDADTVHKPGSLSACLAEFEKSKADLLTLVPKMHMETWGEKLILPLLHFTLFVYLPLAIVRWFKIPAFAFGNGQYLMFRRSAYDTIGRHESVKSALVEDVWLARRIRLHGLNLVIREGLDAFSVRMYHGLCETWQGFSKNVFAGLNYSLVNLSAIVIISTLAYLLPWLFLIIGICTGQEQLPWIILPACQIMLAYGMRLLLAKRFQMSYLSCWLHPIGILFVLGIALNSMRWVLMGGGAKWKGRVYDFRQLQTKV